MRINHKKLDILLLGLLVLVMVGLPVGVRLYNIAVWDDRIASGAKTFTLTGHTDRGWIIGDVKAADVVGLWKNRELVEKPVIAVTEGDRVVLKLKRSDVVHGFSLKQAGIFINDGIKPGSVVLVSFQADEVGTFTFTCNAICGDNHQNMQGTIIVYPKPMVNI
jgi:heme/copper-type cytochrome/quinol oxidase subunit 2